MLDVDGRVEIGMCAVATDPTAKRLLVGPRRIGALDPDGGDTPLGGIPGDLPGDVRQVGGVQVGIHGALCTSSWRP